MNSNHSLHIVVDSIPLVSTSWVDSLSAFLTPLIALIALYIAYQQKMINEQRLRHETYKRRLSVYKSVQKHLPIIIRKGRPSYDECSDFYSTASEAAFLFDESVMEKINLIYSKSINLAEAYEKLYPPDKSPGLTVGEERSKVSQEKADLFKWHSDQLLESRTYFAKKLGLKSK